MPVWQMLFQAFRPRTTSQIKKVTSSERSETIQILQGTLDLMILRTLATMGSQHAYGIASRLQRVSKGALNLNQGATRRLHRFHASTSDGLGPESPSDRYIQQKKTDPMLGSPLSIEHRVTFWFVSSVFHVPGLPESIACGASTWQPDTPADYFSGVARYA